MIRRRVGDEFFLITQHDHALLAGALAGHFGNDVFGAPEPRAGVVRATALHDCGWPLHDDRPTIHPKTREPLDVFEVSRPIALRVWSASADRAEAADAYAGLLTSLHVLSLSVFATTNQSPGKHEKFDTSQLREQFELNKFQHREIERQEQLRKRLGMRLDLPLKYGLAQEGADEREDRLRFDFRLLQGMDLISLALCCTPPPADKTQDVLTCPGGAAHRLALSRQGSDVLVDPWPFGVREIALDVPHRRVPGGTYESDQQLQTVYGAAPVESFRATVRAR